MSQLLGRFYRSQQARIDAAKIDRIIAEAVDAVPETVAKATLPGDKRRLRGIPVAGGACGTSPDTDPYFALERKMSGYLRSVT